MKNQNDMIKVDLKGKLVTTYDNRRFLASAHGQLLPVTGDVYTIKPGDVVTLKGSLCFGESDQVYLDVTK